jgi:hypothetical protein
MATYFSGGAGPAHTVDGLLATDVPVGLDDPNTIGSMLKHWLRELPEPMVPYKIQHALVAELHRDNPHFNVPGQSTPQKLRDALLGLCMATYFTEGAGLVDAMNGHLVQSRLQRRSKVEVCWLCQV